MTTSITKSMTPICDQSPLPGTYQDTSGLFGHPKGMTTLFFTEMWERFSYYGMRAILILYMVAPVAQGGLGFGTPKAGMIYGVYTMMVYMTSIPGGFIADRVLGARNSVLYGGIVIALGHFSLAIKELPFFYLGLGLIIIGTGLLKPNVSTMLGGLYDRVDTRRDAGFSIFYMGINIGAALSPLVCGFLAQSTQFKAVLTSHGIDPNSSWHFGFAAAGIGMLLGLTQYVVQGHRLGTVGKKASRIASDHVEDQNEKLRDQELELEPGHQAPFAQHHSEQSKRDLEAASQDQNQAMALLTTDEWKKLGAIGLLFFFQVLFWAVYEQGGSSLNLFADELTRNELFGFAYPSSWFQTVPAVFCILLAPVFSILWVRLGKKQPTSATKFTLGLLFLSLGIGLMVPASMLAGSGPVSPLWLTLSYLLQVIGEMCLSPVGLSTVTKLAPLKFASATMGLWFLANAFGNYLAGYLGGLFKPDAHTLVLLFGSMAGAGLLATVILWLLSPTIRRLMGNVH